MSRTFRMIQLNVRKQGEIHDSLMNDEEIQDTTVLAIHEPHARRIQGRLLTTPMGHHKWTKMVRSSFREGRWPNRSMLWVNKEVEAEQVRIAGVIHQKSYNGKITVESEVAHLKGIARYASDAWRIFCKDELYRQAGFDVDAPEWTKVLPEDKELCAYITWKRAVSQKQSWATRVKNQKSC